MCRKLEILFTEDAYYRDVEVWLPEIRFGLECMPKCPTCKSNAKVSFHAYRENHFGRKIISLNTCYYIQSRRYICANYKDDNDKLK